MKKLDVCYQNEKVTLFTAPKAGYYEVASKITKSVPTGKLIEMKNIYRIWWKPWTLFQPKTYLMSEYEFVETYEGREVIFLDAGDVVAGPGRKL